ncbi:MAG: hypothetical protein HY689_11755 [Chloroflexi bacterium]|nr:hypothetical protein [Chloroflexota bacterium]
MRGAPGWFSSIAVALLVVTGLLLPTLDHHLAERVPGHAHLPIAGPAAAPLRGPIASHHHAYQRTHAHHPQGTTDPISLDTDTPYVTIATPQAGQPGAWLGLATLWLAPHVVIPPPGALTLMGAAPLAPPYAQVVFPSERPPIALV